MKKVVIMPGGFHPFHAGHKSLYDAARQAFPDADVYVAATDDVSQRPFPFAIKQKLAKLAGVDPAHFVKVKSPFRAEEITQRYGDQADNIVLIFVRSAKDKDKPPKPGGIKKDGTPSYLQPLGGKLEPMSKHAYMTYLPTVQFAGGLTSATEIRQSWPAMDKAAKANLVNLLYPASKDNSKMTKEITQDLDQAIEGQTVDEASMKNDPEQGHIIYPDGGLGGYSPETLSQAVNRHLVDAMKYLKSGEFDKVEYMLYQWGVLESKVHALRKYLDFMKKQGRRPMAANREVDLGEDYLEEKWSEKYKRSIDCSNPKGFSQRAHCDGRKKK